MKTIKVQLSTKSIQNAIDELKAYKKELKSKTHTLVSELAKKGYEYANAYIISVDAIYSGELLKSLSYKSHLNRAVIEVNSSHAIYVEFGTGPKGEASQHPNNIIGYRYNVGETIGWYNVNGSLRYGWYYPDKMTGTWRFTEGMPSRPFMFSTGQYLHNTALLEVVKEVWK